MQVIVKVTTACNLNCTYCSEGDKPVQYMEKEIIKKMIDDLPDLAEKEHTKKIDLLWHGGEPLMMPKEILTEAMDYAQQQLQGYELRFLVQTNGTLVTPEWVDIFKKYGVEVGVSIDGYRELHDENRRKKDGTSSYDDVVSHIHDLQQAGIPVGTLMVLNTEKDIDVDCLYDCIQDIGTSIKIHPVIPCGRAKGDPRSEEIAKKYVTLLKELFVKSMDDENPVTINPLEELINALLGVRTVGECSFAGTCCRGLLCIYPDGGVGYCGRDGVHADFLFGHIQDQSLVELYSGEKAAYIRQRQAYLQQHDCKDCDDWDFCHGGCSFEAINMFQTMYHAYPNCKERRELIEYLRTTGMVLLRDNLIKQKRKRRSHIKQHRQLLEELSHEK